MQVYFIRHGQSFNNELFERTGKDHGRSDDPELTATGRAQADLLARFLSGQGQGSSPASDKQNVRGFAFTHLYTSLHLRTIQTATPIARAMGVRAVAWPDIHEEHGIYLDDHHRGKVGQPGKPRSYFERHHPELALPGDLDEQGWWRGRPAEDTAALEARAQRVADELMRRHADSDDCVAMVSHGAFYGMFMRALLRMPPFRKFGAWFAMNNCAITRIDFDGDVPYVVYSNRLGFLPAELIT